MLPQRMEGESTCSFVQPRSSIWTRTEPYASVSRPVMWHGVDTNDSVLCFAEAGKLGDSMVTAPGHLSANRVSSQRDRGLYMVSAFIEI